MNELKKIFEKYGIKADDAFFEELSTILEGAIGAAVSDKQKELAETHKAEIDERVKAQLKESEEATIKMIENYLVFALEDWEKQNAVAIEDAAKVDMAENILNSAKQMLEQNNVETPENVEILQTQRQKIDEQADRIINLLGEKQEVESQLLETAKAIEFIKNTKGLTDSQVEKLLDLMENVEIDGLNDMDTYVRKLNTLKEAYLAEDQTAVNDVNDSHADTDDSSEDSASVSRFVDLIRKYS